MSTSVNRHSDRFEISVDDDVAGVAQFRDRDGRRIIFHTEIGADFGGQGLASTLVQRAIADTREEGLSVVPMCSYVAGWLERHPEHADISVEPTPEDRTAVGA